MSITDGIGQTPSSFEHYLVVKVIVENVVRSFLWDTVYRGLSGTITHIGR